MKYITTVFISLLLAIAPVHGKNSGELLLDKVAEWCKEKGSIECDYTVKSGNEAFNGTLTVSDGRHHMHSAIMDSWFDGTTQWSFNPRTNEVNITTPTDEEIMQANPFAIFDAFRQAYSVGEARSSATGNYRTVTMTAKEKASDIARVDLIVAKDTAYPARIVVRMRSGETITLIIKRIVRGVNYPASAFVYNPASHPDAVTIDFR